LSVGRYQLIWAQVFWFRYRYLYMLAGVVADVCTMARPMQCNNTLGRMRVSLDYWYRCMQQQYWVRYKH